MNTIRKFSLLQAFFFSAWAAFAGFNVYYLREAGFSNTEIGFAMSVMMGMGVLGQTFWGYICDRTRSVKRVHILCMVLLATTVSLYPLNRTIVSVTLSMGIIGFMWMPQQAIIDSWIFASSAHLARNYGFMRAWGSLGYALVALIFGRAIELFGWNIMFVTHVFLAAVTILIAVTLKDAHKARSSKQEDSPIKTATAARSVNPLELFQNKEYVFLLLASVLLFIPNRLAVQFMPEMIRFVGGTPTHHGVSLFINAVSEVPILFWSTYFLARFPSRLLLVFASIFFPVRLTLLFFASTPGAVMAASVFQGLSFGVFLPTIRYFINEISPNHLKTSAQSIATASFFGVSSVVGSFLGGYVIDTFGMRMSLAGASVLSTIAMFIVVLRFGCRRRKV